MVINYMTPINNLYSGFPMLEIVPDPQNIQHFISDNTMFKNTYQM